MIFSTSQNRKGERWNLVSNAKPGKAKITSTNILLVNSESRTGGVNYCWIIPWIPIAYIGSMYGNICLHVVDIYGKLVGKYTIYGSSGILVCLKECPDPWWRFWDEVATTKTTTATWRLPSAFKTSSWCHKIGAQLSHCHFLKQEFGPFHHETPWKMKKSWTQMSWKFGSDDFNLLELFGDFYTFHPFNFQGFFLKTKTRWFKKLCPFHPWSDLFRSPLQPFKKGSLI